MEREQIGKAVLDYHFYTGEDKYTDGAIEDEMLEIAKNCAPEEYDRVITDVPFWSPCFGILTQQAGETLLVVTPEQRSVACCDRLRTSSLGQQMAHPGLVINRFHRKQFWKEGAFSDLDEVIDRCGIPLRAVVPEDPFLAHEMTEVLAETTHYEKIPFRQKGKAGAVAIHCLAHRLQGERIPLRRLEGL